jgi:MFS family permease
MPSSAAHERRWWVLFAIGVGTFMSALDGSVVNTILPLLRRELHASVAGIQWVTTVYPVVSVAGSWARRRPVLKRTYSPVRRLAGPRCARLRCAWALASEAVGAAMLANAPAILTGPSRGVDGRSAPRPR